jgi:AbrB family looped-hinge helix DNA binding protein
MKTTIDKAGRLVIPKAIRDRQRLVPGTEVEVVESGDRIELILPDDRDEAILVEKDGRLVISADAGQTVTLDETLAVRDALRAGRGL